MKFVCTKGCCILPNQKKILMKSIRTYLLQDLPALGGHDNISNEVEGSCDTLKGVCRRLLAPTGAEVD